MSADTPDQRRVPRRPTRRAKVADSGVVAALTVFITLGAVTATLMAGLVWLDTGDAVIEASTLDGTVYCDGRFPDSWTGSLLSPAEARDVCDEARDEESARRWRATGTAAVLAAVAYGLFRLAIPKKRWR